MLGYENIMDFPKIINSKVFSSYLKSRSGGKRFRIRVRNDLDFWAFLSELCFCEKAISQSRFYILF